MSQKIFTISETLELAWNKFKENPTLWLGLSFISILIGSLSDTETLTEYAGINISFPNFSGIIFGLLSVYLSLAIYKIAIESVRGNEVGFNEKPIHMSGRPQEVKVATCSADKSRKLLNYSTKTTLQQSVKYTAEYIKKMGARPLARIIDNDIKTPISRKLLFEDTKKTSTIDITAKDDKLEIEWK